MAMRENKRIRSFRDIQKDTERCLMAHHVRVEAMHWTTKWATNWKRVYSKRELLCVLLETYVADLHNSSITSYDPTPSATISTRALSLREMMRRDGCTSVWPSLKSLCEDVVAEQFSKKVLPLLSQNTAGEGQPSNSVGPGSPEARSRFGSSRATAKHSYGSLEMRLVHHKDDDSFIPARKEVRHESGYSAARARLLRESSNAGASLNSARMAKPIQQLKHEADTYARAETLEAQNEYLMTILPTNSAFRIKSILEKSQPTLLTFDVLQRLFLTKQRVALARRFTLIATDVESVSKNAREVALLLRGIMSEEVASLGPLHIIPQIVPPTQHLSALNLTAFVRLKSIQLHSLIAASPNLQDVTLRGCLSIDEETPMALMHHCRSLRRANFTWTSIGPVGFKYLLCAKELETLKVAHVRGLTDVAVRRAMEEATLAGKAAEPPFVPLNNLANLKLRSTEVSLHGLGVMLKHCGSKLVSLDVGGNFLGDANIQDFVELISPSQIQPNNNQRLRNATLTKLVMYPPTPYASKPELSLCDAIEVLIRNFTALRTLKIEGRSSDWCDPFQVFSSHATSEYKGHVDSLIVRDMSPSAQRRTTDDEVIREFDKLAFPVGQHSEEKKVGISLKCQKTDFTRAYCKLSGKVGRGCSLLRQNNTNIADSHCLSSCRPSTCPVEIYEISRSNHLSGRQDPFDAAI